MTQRSHDPYSIHQVRKGLLNFLISKGVQIVAGIATLLLLVRTLSVDDYALYVTCSALAALVGSLSLFGLDRAASRFVPEALLNGAREVLLRFLRKLAALRLLAVGAVAAVLVVAWPWVAPLFGLPTLRQQPLLVAGTIAWSVLHAMLFFQTAVMQSLMCQAAIRNGTALVAIAKVSALAVAFVAWDNFSGAAAVLVSVSVELLGLVWLARAQDRHIKALSIGPNASVWKPNWSAIRRFSWQNYLSGQFTLPTQLKPLQLIAATVLQAPEMAAFGFLTNLASNLRILLPLYLFRSLLEPVMIGKYLQGARNAAGFAVTAATVGKLCAIVVFALVGWLSIAGRDFVTILTGGRYGDQAWMMALLVAGMLPACWRTLAMLASNAEGTNAAMLKITALTGGLTAILLAISAIGKWVIPLLLSEAFFSIVAVTLYFYSRRANTPMLCFEWQPLLRLSMVSLCAAGVAWGSGQMMSSATAGVRVVVFVVAFLSVYLSGVHLVKALAAEDIALVRRILHGRRSAN